MRIAIFEPDPRVCGPSSWAYHLRDGYRILGHEADVVTATKSGKSHAHFGNVKPGGKWWSVAPDAVGKHDSMHHLLDTYDFIILPEPKSPLADKTTAKENVTVDEKWDAYFAQEGADQTLERKGKKIPWYVESLAKTSTPFTTALHGNVYAGRYAPFAQTILELPNFCGKLIVHSDYSWHSDPFIESVPGFKSVLPFKMRHAIDDPFPRGGRTAGITGRFMFNKGSHVAGLAGIHLDPSVTVEIWGSCSAGRGPSLTYNLYEELKPLAGKNYKRYHNSDMTHPKASEDGNIVQPFPYDVRPEGGALVRYLGNYTDPVAVCERLNVHIDLTGKKYSGGLTEFVTMEAMDAGSICITPPHVSSPDYRTYVLEGFTDPPGSVTTALKKPDVTMMTVDAVNKCLEWNDRPEGEHRELVEFNRESLQKNASPDVIGQRILDECL